jgi:lipopolysaccharide biosynthesis glycosyltransferase
LTKKNRAVVFAVSKDLAFSVACVMMDIKKLSPNLADEIVVIHNGIQEKDQKLLTSILPTRFIHYSLPIDKSLISDDILNYFTEMVFAKFECLRLLDEYENVMLMDYDMVIQEDISELFEHCDSGTKMMPSEVTPVRKQLHVDIEDYDMDVIGNCACIFVFQDHLKNYKKAYDFCYESLIKYHDKIYLPEQAIFDFMIQEFNLQICPIDGKIYSPHPTDSENAKNAKIIHAYGQPKFWNGLENEQWNKNYKIWIEMGGSKYKKKSPITRVKNKIVNILSRIK